MANEPLLAGIERKTIETSRLKVSALFAGPDQGQAVMLVHGNVSSSIFWEETMLALAAQNHRVIAPDLRGYGDTEALSIDATRGMGDWADDLKAMSDALQLGPVHLAGWSMGAEVVMQYAIDNPDEVLSLTLVAAAGPWGHGGTKDLQGTPTFTDFAGSGGGTANPEFARLLAAGDRSADSPLTPRNTMLSFYFKPPFKPAPEREEAFVSSMLSTRVGDGFYPGDMTPSENWPTVAPGPNGINNAFSPKYCNLGAFLSISPKPPVLWIRGADDQIVSDTSLFEFGFLGMIGAVPGWPGAEVYPPQPMIGQMRAFLEGYKENGGQYWERVFEDCGHSPHIEKPEDFQQAMLAHLKMATA